MITVEMPGTMRCDEPSCEATAPVQFCLLGTGAFAFKPSDTTWQVVLPEGNPGAPFGCRCPAHKRAVPIIQGVQLDTRVKFGPVGPRTMKPNGH